MSRSTRRSQTGLKTRRSLTRMLEKVPSSEMGSEDRMGKCSEQRQARRSNGQYPRIKVPLRLPGIGLRYWAALEQSFGRKSALELGVVSRLVREVLMPVDGR